MTADRALEVAVDGPPDLTTAAEAIQALLSQADDTALAIANASMTSGDADTARVMAEVVKQLALGRELTYGQSW